MRKVIIYLYLVVIFIGYYSILKGEELKSKHIVTQTFLSYEKENGEIFLAVSNYVKINVNEIVEFEVKNYFPELDVQLEEELTLLYTLKNTGNFEESYLMVIENPEIFSEYNVYIDSNKNGILDEEEEIPLNKIAKNMVEIPLIMAGNFKNIIIRSKLNSGYEFNRIEFKFKLQSNSKTELKKEIRNIFNIQSKRKVNVTKGIYFDSRKKQYYFTFKFLNESLEKVEKLFLEDIITEEFKINSYLGLWQEFGETEKQDVTLFLDGYEKNAPNLKVSLINKKLEVELKQIPSKEKIDTGGILFIPFYLDDSITENKQLHNIAKYNYILNNKNSESYQTNEVIFFKKYVPLLVQKGAETYTLKKVENGYEIEIITTITNVGNGADRFNVAIKNSNFPQNIFLSNLNDSNGDGYLDTGVLEIGESKDVIIKGKLTEEELKNDYSLNLLFNSVKEKEYKFSTGIKANLDLIKLLTEIKCDKRVVKKGDIFKIKIGVDNFYNTDIEDMKIHLILPQGFSYIDNSAWIEDNEVSKVEKFGKKLVFYLKKPLQKKEKINLEVSIKTDILSRTGENIFKTFSQGIYLKQREIYSNKASCKIQIDEDNVVEKGTIFGVVYIDENRNGQYDYGEITVPNVKIFLENGHFALSDKEGKYSIFGERPVTHVAKIDKESIPQKGKLIQLDNRYGKKGDFAVVDLKKNELYKLNFAFFDVDEKFLQEVENRKKINKSIITEVEEVVEKEELLFTSVNSNNGAIKVDGYFDDRMNSLAGSIEKYEKEKIKRILEKKNREKKEKIKLDNELDQTLTQNLKERLKKLTNELEIMNLKNNDVVSEVVSIEIKDSSENRLELYLNNQKISEQFIGIKGDSPSNKVAYYRFDGIKLKPESNVINVVSISPNGEKKEKKLTVVYPVKIRDVELLYNEESLKIAAPLEFKILLKGERGEIIKESYFATLESNSGVWIAPEDLSNDKHLQFIIENGEQNLKLLPTIFNGEIILRLKIKEFEKEFRVNLKSSRENNILLGIIEGKVNFDNKKMDIFQDSLSYRRENSDMNFSYRAAILSKGKINEDYQYLFTYDNTKKDSDIFYQNAKRDDYYLVLGDDSIKGYEGQSTSKLYLSIVGENARHLYGDYDISWKDSEFDVGNYSRRLNGYKINYDNKQLSFEGFITKTSNVQQIEEIAARNVSGPYYVGSTSIIENSEKVEIVVYDPNNLDIPLTVVQAPNYSFDHDTGILYFDTIIPQKDKNGNLLYIRISYEVENSAGEKFYLYGANFSYGLSDKLRLGMSYFKDENPEILYENKSLNLIYEDKRFGKLIVERGESKKELEKGKATLVKYKNENIKNLKTNITYYDSDIGFENPNSFVKNGARLFLIENTYKISDSGEILIEGFNYKDKKELKEREELVLEYKKTISESSKIIAGTRYLENKDSDKKKTYGTLGIKYEWNPIQIQGLSTYLEYEQDIDVSRNKRIAVASEYDIKENLKVYGKYDFVNRIESTNIIGRYKSTYSKLLGIEYNKLEYIKPYIELRENSSGDKDKEMAFGFKSEYKYKDKLTLSTVFERVESIESNPNPNSTNFALSYNYKWNNKKMSFNSMDISNSDKKTSVLAKNSYGIKLREDLTVVIKNRYFIEDIRKNRVRDRLLFGIAYRGKDDIYNSLYKYEMVYDDKLENTDYIHLTHLINSVHNYQLNKKMILSFGAGLKYTKDRNNFGYSRYIRGIGDLNWKYLYNKKFDFGINTAFMLDNRKNLFYAIGIEGGYRVNNNFWFGIGYNFKGFEDRDFYEDDKYRKGMYFKFRLLLEESIFEGF